MSATRWAGCATGRETAPARLVGRGRFFPGLTSAYSADRAGGTKLVWVDNIPIVLVNDAGTIYALYGLCSHQNNPLEGGTVWKGVLDCPWHHFQWHIRTGENVFPKNVYPLNAMPHFREQVRSLRTYPVSIVEDYVEVEMDEEGGEG